VAPVHDFGFIDREARIVSSSEARSCANGAIHIDDDSASSAYEVMMVVADAIFVQSRRANGLNPSN
jgi:mevalonate pyrophosphate decarboxylase